MEYQLSYFETVDEFTRNQPDSRFVVDKFSAALVIAGNAVTGGNIKIVKVESADERLSLLVMAGVAPRKPKRCTSIRGNDNAED
jgi:hypothetical protein